MRVAWATGAAGWAGALVGRVLAPIGDPGWWAAWIVAGIVLAWVGWRHLR